MVLTIIKHLLSARRFKGFPIINISLISLPISRVVVSYFFRRVTRPIFAKRILEPCGEGDQWSLRLLSCQPPPTLLTPLVWRR